MQLLAEAAEQEQKEFLLAYTVLLLAKEPLTSDQVKGSANAILARADAENITDFDYEDALEGLASADVLIQSEPEGLLTVRPATDAKTSLCAVLHD